MGFSDSIRASGIEKRHRWNGWGARRNRTSCGIRGFHDCILDKRLTHRRVMQQLHLQRCCRPRLAIGTQPALMQPPAIDCIETMIPLTRLNHVPLVVNSDLIEHIEVTPDTVVALTTGQKFLVLESAEDVVERVIQFRRAILAASACPLKKHQEQETESAAAVSAPAWIK